MQKAFRGRRRQDKEVIPASGPQPFGTRAQFRGRQFFHGQGGERGMVQAVMWAMGSSRGSFSRWPAAHLLLSARSLTGCGPVTVCSLGVGDP